MATGSSTSTHPLLACVEAIEDALDTVTGDGSGGVGPAPDPDYLGLDDKADYLVRLDRVQARVAALQARALAGAREVADAEGFKDPGAWLAAATVTTPQAARRAFRLGTRLPRRPVTAAAWGSGRMSTAHAHAVVECVDQLPASLGAELVGRIEATLVGYCADHTPPEIRRLGAHALEVAAPDEADHILEKLLAAEEERARAATTLTIRDRGDGTAKIHGIVPSLTAAVLTAALDSYTNPRRACHDHDPGGVHEPTRPDETGTDNVTGDPEVDRLTPAQKRGRALAALVEHLPTHELPVSGGTPVTIGVTITEERLRSEAGAGHLDDGTLTSAGQVRRLLCQHGAFPIVLGGRSAVLDAGRLKRLFTPDMIRTKRTIQSTCQTTGCTVPARWCQAHHRTPWSHGGITRLDDLVLLCGHHHQRIHDHAYAHHYDRRDRVTLTRINRRT